VDKIIAIAAASVISFAASSYAIDKLDGVAAVVGDSIILCSEVDAYVMMRNTAGGTSAPAAPDSASLPKLRKQYIQELVDGKVLIVHAAKDTTIIVSNDEVEQALNNHIQQIETQNNITPDALEKELKEKYGMGLSKFRAQLRAQFREQLVKQKVQQQYIPGVQISRNDVEAFFAQYKDSLPSIGESVLLSKIVVRLKPADSLRQVAFAKINGIKHRLDNGEDFAALAKQYSEDPSAENGGDLGFIKKGTLNELKFEEIAFSLNIGQVSEVFESRLGFHIVTAVAKKDQMVRVRQIFVAVSPPQAAIDHVMAQLDSVRTHASSEADFIDAVGKFSTDNQTKSKNGRMGWVPLYSLPDRVRSALDSLKSGQIGIPLRDGNEFSLFRVDDRVQNRALTLSDDFDLLAEKTKEIMAQKKLLDLVKKWRRDVYVDIRL
jgi:peptidyl-prolyl cis-trans isomerase SurA